MVTNFGMLHHDMYTKYPSRHATSNITDTTLYGDNNNNNNTFNDSRGQDGPIVNVQKC